MKTPNDLDVLEIWAANHGIELPEYEFGMNAEAKRFCQSVWDSYITRVQLAGAFDGFHARKLHGLVERRFAVRGQPEVPRYNNIAGYSREHNVAGRGVQLRTASMPSQYFKRGQTPKKYEW